MSMTHRKWRMSCALRIIWKERDDPEEADVLLLNTCSIREKAQEKVFSELGRLRVLKENNPNIIIGVGGCVASQEGSSHLKASAFCGYGIWSANPASNW